MTDLDTARNTLAAAQEQLAAAEAVAAQKQAAQDQAEADATAHRKQTAGTYYENLRQQFPITHRGEVDQAWQAFLDAVRTHTDIHTAWINYRCTRAALHSEWAEIAAHFDAIDQQAYQTRKQWHGLLATEAQYLGTTDQQGRRTDNYRRRLAAWNKSYSDYSQTARQDTDLPFVPDHPERPRRFIARYGYSTELRDDETFSKAFEKALRIVEREHIAELAQQRSAEIDTLAKKKRR